MSPRLSFIFILLFMVFVGQAQEHYKGDNECSISEGMLSVDEIAGIMGNNGPAANYMSFPNSITGAFFLSYRHFVTDNFSLGVTLGLDNQQGDLSYGRIDHGMFGIDGVTGRYRRNVYTAGIEGRLIYYKKDRFETYGSLGVGYSEMQLHYQFNQGINYPAFFYGTPTSLVPTNPYHENSAHVNGQFVPVGIRYGGSSAVFIEFGAGYKGIINGGFSYNIRGKRLPKKVSEVSEQSTIFLPATYPIDSNFKYLGSVRTGNPQFDPHACFEHQLDMLSAKVKLKNGNVFKISRAFDSKQTNKYSIRGEAYSCSAYDSLKAAMAASDSFHNQHDQFATVVIYHPHYNYSLNSGTGVRLYLNGERKLIIKKNQQITLKLTTEGHYTFATKRRYSEGVDVKFGHTYYIKAGVELPDRFGLLDGTLFSGRTFIETASDMQGRLESSLVSEKEFIDISK